MTGAEHSRYVTVQNSSSYAGPSWRSVDLSKPNLTSSAPSLVVVETVVLRDQQSNCDGNSSAPSAGWRLQADPGKPHNKDIVSFLIIKLDNIFTNMSTALGHGVHITSVGACEAYLLSISWMEKALESDHNDARSVSSADLCAEEGSADSGASPLVYPTKILPVFVLPPQVVGADQEHKGTSEAKSGGRSGKDRGGATAQEAQLSGAVILQDAMLGHVAIFRTTSGLASAVNLTVHTKLCELQESLQVQNQSWTRT